MCIRRGREGGSLKGGGSVTYHFWVGVSFLDR